MSKFGVLFYCVLIKFVYSNIEDNDWRKDLKVLCPNECVCQYSNFLDLSIARWVTYTQMAEKWNFLKRDEDLLNENEANYLHNPYTKLATCLVQPETDTKKFFNGLPIDIQALVILFTGEKQNVTVFTSDLKPFEQLTTLEIRGAADRSSHLIVDEPLSFVQNVYFESIKLIGSESVKRPVNPVHPSESFDYVPNSEKIGYDTSLLDSEEQMDEREVEIIPYEQYIIEMKKSRLATFYGWEHLEILRIHNCKMDELYWEMFDGLNELQHLSLERNEIKIIPAFALYGALHIKTLSLANNNILDLHYRSLAGLLELEILDLSYNNLTKLSELTFPPFPKLEFVDFRYNPINYIFPATFGIMNYTKTMFLGSEETELELTTNNPFESLNLLKYLSIFNVNINSLNRNIFSSLNNLEYLKLNGHILTIDFDAFVDMPRIKEIDLSHCNLQKISMDAFIECKHLEIIDLSYNNISYLPPGLFDDQMKLKEIYLNHNNLRYLPDSRIFTSTMKYPSLKLIRLLGNPWKCSCEMIVWKPNLTNRYRGKKQQQCIKDFHSGNIISCRTMKSYKFDNKLAPRCNNLNNRSVYYALRKDLQCNLNKELKKHQLYNSRRNRKSQRNSKGIRKQTKPQKETKNYKTSTLEVVKEERKIFFDDQQSEDKFNEVLFEDSTNVKIFNKDESMNATSNINSIDYLIKTNSKTRFILNK